jgi:hypothetical protein
VVVEVHLDKTPDFRVLLVGLAAAAVAVATVLPPALLPVLAIPQVHHHHRGILVAAVRPALVLPTMALEVVAEQAQ